MSLFIDVDKGVPIQMATRRRRKHGGMIAANFR
jgi:hypothetical protein